MDECEEDGASVASSSRSYYAEGCSVEMSSRVSSLYRKVAHEKDIPSQVHVEVSQILLKIQQGLVNGDMLSKQSQMLLMCTLSSLHRRIIRMEDTAFFADTESMRVMLKAGREDFIRTATFIFITIAIADAVARKGGGAATTVERTAATVELEECMQRSLWIEVCRPPSKKRAMEPTETQSVDGVPIDPVVFERSKLEHLVDRPTLCDEKSSVWTTVLHQPGSIAGSAVRMASCMLPNAVNENAFRSLMFTFSRYSSLQMHVQMLNATLNDRDFLTLAARRFAIVASDEIEDALLPVVSAAESECGQLILRDLMLSFLLPRSVVGHRRTLALSREASTAATAGYALITETAHQTAMQGPEFIWRNSTSELKRMCALLAGIAVLTTKTTDDMVRKATAFDGLVQLPFLETVPPPLTQQRLALVPTTRSWVLYTVSPKGMPIVELSKRGFQGLLYAALAFKEHTFS